MEVYKTEFEMRIHFTSENEISENEFVQRIGAALQDGKSYILISPIQPLLPSAVTGGVKETDKEKKYEMALQIIACWNPEYYSSKSMNDVARKALGGEPLPFDPPSEGRGRNEK